VFSIAMKHCYNRMNWKGKCSSVKYLPAERETGSAGSWSAFESKAKLQILEIGLCVWLKLREGISRVR